MDPVTQVFTDCLLGSGAIVGTDHPDKVWTLAIHNFQGEGDKQRHGYLSRSDKFYKKG
jgi:hypothetical protein